MSAISIGYLPTSAATWDAVTARRLVDRCDAAGLDHLAAGDHISFHIGAGSDGLTMAARLLSLSDRLAVNTAVYLLPLRHPVVVARQLADLAAFAPGRFTFGVGVGGEDPHEYEVCGVDPSTRGRRMDACMDIVRSLLAGEAVDHDSELFSLDRAMIIPKPAMPVPMVVGGRSDAALRRAGRLGDGWIGVWISPDRYSQSIDTVHAAAADAARGDVDWANGLNVWCGVGSSADEVRPLLAQAMQDFYQLPFERFERWSPYGTPAQLAEFLVPYVAAGCSTFNLIAVSSSPEASIDGAAEVAQLMRAHLGA